VAAEKQEHVSELNLTALSDQYNHTGTVDGPDFDRLIAEARLAAAHRVEIDELRRVHAQCVERAQKAERERDELAAACKALLAAARVGPNQIVAPRAFVPAIRLATAALAKLEGKEGK